MNTPPIVLYLLGPDYNTGHPDESLARVSVYSQPVTRCMSCRSSLFLVVYSCESSPVH